MDPVIQLIQTESRSRVEEWVRSRARTVVTSESTALCRVLGKWLMYVDPRDQSLAPWLMFDGFWEMWVTQAIARHVRPGMRVADVGANFGYYTLLLAELVGEEGQVWSFEPLAETFGHLSRTLSLSGYGQRVHASNHALGAKEETAKITCDLNRLGDAEVHYEPDYASGRHVRVRALDDLAVDFDFIKIDAEGSEPEIWEGMRQLTFQRSPVLCMEFNPEKLGPRGLDLLTAIVQSGYRLAKVDTTSRIVAADPASLLAGGVEMLWLERAK